MFSIPSNSSVLVGGSRSLVHSSPAGQACVQFTGSLLNSGFVLHAGCATGADQISFQSAAFGSCVHVFAAFAQSGAGSFPGSAVQAVQLCGHPVSWLAGGPLSIPLVARLMARSVAALVGCGAAVFFQPGIGSLKVARHALRQGIPVLVSCAGMGGLPPLLAVPARLVSWLGQSFWLFAPPHQPALL